MAGLWELQKSICEVVVTFLNDFNHLGIVIWVIALVLFRA